MRTAILCLPILILGCNGDTSAPVDMATAPDLTPAVEPGADSIVTPFDRKPVYFTGNDNQRVVDATASFPARGTYKSITLHLELACPAQGCDPWDRLASLGVVTQKGANGAPDTVVEIMRFITPFGVGAAWDLDVTDLRPLLTGDITLRGFIDTWVGPGSQYGDGWLLTARFDMKGGTPARLAIANLPVWTQRSVIHGDPKVPVAGSAPPATVALPAASSYALRTFVTGHGQGNADNCAEFCETTHTISVGGKAHDHFVWRDDCATTAAPNQRGTWRFPRSGWCPGADTRPLVDDITADVAGAASVTVSYAIEEYTNTCRPDAMPCTGCTLGTGCAYDGGSHTEPYFSLSSLIIAYR